ncbi:LuxR family transcriptional regulator [Luteipulveratus mongoliensis]|uniref:HTH luxR-type domain-containing protein n=1 Tax=Luteipulveratus mongoliensis TaxID=571913 RepID=A0A0K1JFW4_9MICO|nr:LuxR family transcriptional regulator [Luteipulveratus mongoliensis]AKU15594.1 hypothetical protein VV02_06535 [Luteipulveratus mongoliensis]
MDEAPDVSGHVLTRITAGKPQVVLVEGGRGSGRSTTLHDLTAQLHDAGVGILRARCHREESGHAYGVIRQLLDDVEDLPSGTSVGSHEQSERFYRTTRRRSDARPLAIVIDDLRHADGPSLQALTYLSRRLDNLPVALIVVLDSDGPHAGTLADELRQLTYTTTVSMTAYTPDEEVQALRTLSGRTLSEHTLQICRHTTRGVRQAVAVLARQLGSRLPAHDGDIFAAVLTACAITSWQTWYQWLVAEDEQVAAIYRAMLVLEPEASLSSAALLQGLGETAALQAGVMLHRYNLICGEGEHLLHRGFVPHHYRQLPVEDSLQLHASAAQLSTQVGSSARTVAHHLMAAGTELKPDDLAVFRRASNEAMQVGDWPFALRTLRYALLRSSDRSAATGLAVDLHDVQLRTDVNACLQSTVGLVNAGLEPHQIARELAPISHLVLVLSHAPVSHLVRDLAQQDELADEGSPCRRRSFDLAAQALVMGDATSARRLMRTLTSTTSTGRDRDAAGLRAAWALSVAAHGKERERCRALMHEVAPDLVTLSQLDPTVIALAALTATWAEELDAAQLWASEGASVARSEQRYADEGLNLMVRAEAHDRLGDPELAYADALAAEEAFAKVSADRLADVARALAARAALKLGRHEEAQSLVAEVEVHQGAHPYFSAIISSVKGQVCERQGDDTGAMTHLLDCPRYLDAAGIRNPVAVPWRAEVVRIMLRTKRHGVARALCARELESSRTWGAPATVGRALRTHSTVLGREHRLEVLEDSVAHLEEAGLLAEVAHTLSEMSALQALRGDMRAATTSLTRADELKAAVAQVRPIGSTRSACPQISGLTAAEWRVVIKVMEGLSNAAVAKQLYLSKRTIDTHLGRIYRKLGINSRQQLAAVVGTPPPLASSS